LIQSHEKEIRLLPTLPRVWPDGRVKGLRARGGFIFDLWWKDNKLSKVRVQSLCGNPCRLMYNGNLVSFNTGVGGTYVRNGSLQQF
ncbi:MAG: hypothetical protein P4L51_03335, partial [Puia sp.]|nr:hypothetical protein [Puia sp.]